MRTNFFTPKQQMITATTFRDVEKEQIMARIYGSDVFQEFTQQWGNVMTR